MSPRTSAVGQKADIEVLAVGTHLRRAGITGFRFTAGPSDIYSVVPVERSFIEHASPGLGHIHATGPEKADVQVRKILVSRPDGPGPGEKGPHRPDKAPVMAISAPTGG